jgi:hypothetical protein
MAVPLCLYAVGDLRYVIPADTFSSFRLIKVIVLFISVERLLVLCPLIIQLIHSAILFLSERSFTPNLESLSICS